MNLKVLALAASLSLAATCAAAQSQWPGGDRGGPLIPSTTLTCVNDAGTFTVPCGNATTPVKISGSFSASLSGFAYAAYANLTSTATTSASTALPAGTDVVISNTGTTAVSCTPANGAATGVINNIQVPAGTSLQYTKVGGADHIACINQNGDATSNKVVLQGGAGLATGWGGGSGGGSSAIATWGGATLGAATSYGVAPTGNVNGVNAFITNANANGQAAMANSSPVVVASNQSAIPTSVASGGIASGALASGSVASGALASGSVSSGAFASGSIGSGALASGSVASGAFASGSFLNATAGDPCMFQAKTNVAISTASGTTALVTGVSAKRVYVCSLSLVATTAIAVSLSEGSSSTCGTSAQAAVLGVATNGTAANGISLAANGGLTLGNGGGTVAATVTNANYLCLFQSGTAQLSGNLTYVQQ